MLYSVEKPPDWLKNLPKGAVKLGVNAFNAVLDKDGEEDAARKAAWAAVKTKYEKGERGQWRAKQDVSLRDIERLLREAIDSRNKDAWLRDVYGSYVIYEQDGKYFRLPYSILEGEVQFAADAAEVEQVWVEARSQQAESEEMDDGIEVLLRLGEAKDPEGAAWDVTICEPGFTKNGWYIPDDALRDAAGMFENVDVNLYELPQGATHVPDALFDIKSLLVKNKVGWIDNVKHAADKGLSGVLHFLDSAKWLGKNLLEAVTAGAKIYGLSYDAPVRAKKEVIENRPVFKLLKFLAADSVDIVTRPAAGGKFNRAVAAQKEVVMDKKQLWEMISKARPDLIKGKEFDSVSENEVVELARMAMEPFDPAQGGAGGSGGDGQPAGTGEPDEPQPVTQDDLARFRCEMALKEKLSATDLPDPAKDRIRATFADRVFEPADLDKAIADEKDYLAKMAEPVDNGDGVPASGIGVGIGTLERAQMAADRLFDLTKEDVETLARMETLEHRPFFTEHLGATGFNVRSVQDVADYNDVPAFRSIREMYAFFTGDPDVTGNFNRKKLPADLRAKMDITSSTFTYVLGNTLGRRLVKVYKEADYKENLLISVRKTVRDFRTQEAVLVGGFSDLATVDPEAADYEEISAVTDEESTYSIGQKGNILTITRKTIINDDITIINRLIRGIGRAARRTHGKYVWTKYIDNDNCTDGTAVFTGGHGNLGSSALTHATALVGWKALAAMTEKDSGEYLGLLDASDVVVNLIGPPALKDLTGRIEKEEFYYSSNDLTTKLPNPLFGEVKGHTLSLLAGDANDWYMVLPPQIAELIEMGYLNGRQEPEMFVADSPQSEQVFVADKIRHKIRHEYAGVPIDYRGSYKAVVA